MQASLSQKVVTDTKEASEKFLNGLSRCYAPASDFFKNSVEGWEKTRSRSCKSQQTLGCHFEQPVQDTGGA